LAFTMMVSVARITTCPRRIAPGHPPAARLQLRFLRGTDG
jgi:hypothetical protein